MTHHMILGKQSDPCGASRSSKSLRTKDWRERTPPSLIILYFFTFSHFTFIGSSRHCIHRHKKSQSQIKKAYNTFLVFFLSINCRMLVLSDPVSHMELFSIDSVDFLDERRTKIGVFMCKSIRNGQKAM